MLTRVTAAEHIWEDPYKFDPDRFMAHAGSKDDPDGCESCPTLPFAHSADPSRRRLAGLPFSSGLRGCIGRQFSIGRLFII